MKNIICFFGLFLYFLSTSFGQTKTITPSALGFFSHRNYLKKEYGGNPQIHDILQDDRGMMYFANYAGVLEYDGSSWRTIKIGEKNQSTTCLAKGNNSQIYVGGRNQFGVLTPNKYGLLEYQSLLDKYNIDSIGVVYSIIVCKDNITLQTSSEILILDSSKLLNRIQLDNRSKFYYRHNIFLFENEVYVYKDELGLYKIVNNSLEKVQLDKQFDNNYIDNIITFAGKTLILMDNGIFEWVSMKKPPVFLANIPLIHSSKIVNGMLSIGTFKEGVLLFDSALNIKHVIDEKTITDKTIKCQFQDNEGNLWLGTNRGISKVAINSGIIKYDRNIGLKGGVEDIQKFQNAHIFATSHGLYKLDILGISKIHSKTDFYGLDVININNESFLFISQLNELYVYDENENLYSIEKGGPYQCIQSPLDSSEIIVIHYNGISKLKYENGAFSKIKSIKGFTKMEPFNAQIDLKGNIWIGTLKGDSSGILKGHVNMFNDSIPKFKYYGQEQGLPKGSNYLFFHDGKLFTGHDNGIFLLKNEKFSPYNEFGINFTKENLGVHRINKDKFGNIWMILFDDEGRFQYGFSSIKNGKYIWNNSSFLGYTDEIIHTMFHEENGISWLGGLEGVIRYDGKSKDDEELKIESIFRKIIVNGNTIYNGYKISPNNSYSLPYVGNNSLLVEYSCNSFINEEGNEYSYFIEGMDSVWSDWSNKTFKELNLNVGVYEFKLKAKNVNEIESSISSFKIEILPPWYRTSWAYLLYTSILSIITFVFAYILRSNKLIKVQRKQSDEQRKVIEESHKEITDSINYAKRIQSAILPPTKLVKEYLQESFILYKPKDIIAGDFYWMEHKDGKILFAAADCTGHGVPGAMVSVVCNNGLNRSVREYGLSTPGKILDKTREIVIQEFEKSEDEVKDGMDIALCSIDGNKLQYAGAHNPLWIIRNGEVIETKANKQPIGKFDKQSPYTTHTFDLVKGDSIYLFSDGYVDQFGGEKGKKFKSKPFKALLLSIQDKSMEEQKGILNKAFEDWRGTIEQIDDVCIIGVRI